MATDLTQKAFDLVKRASRGAEQAGRSAIGAIGAIGDRVAGGSRASQPKPGMDDVTLARKVESILFREPDAPKGEVDVSAVDGVVELRGEVKHPEDVRALETKARAIPEVRDVRNLLHLPSTPSPTRTDSPESHRKRAETHRAEEHGAEVATGERTPEIAEDGPAEKAEKGEGRGPAPLGSES